MQGLCSGKALVQLSGKELRSGVAWGILTWGHASTCMEHAGKSGKEHVEDCVRSMQGDCVRSMQGDKCNGPCRKLT